MTPSQSSMDKARETPLERAREIANNLIGNSLDENGDVLHMTARNAIVHAITEAEARGMQRVLDALPHIDEFYSVVNNGVTMLSSDEMYNWLRSEIEKRMKGDE